jgi:H+/Cl- antiporter ClcA
MSAKTKVKSDFYTLIAGIIIITLAALLLALILVYPWNWLNDAMRWKLSLNYWHCFLVLDVLGVFLILYMVFIPQQGSGWNDQKVDAYIDEQVGPGYWDHNDPYDDY